MVSNKSSGTEKERSKKSKYLRSRETPSNVQRWFQPRGVVRISYVHLQPHPTRSRIPPSKNLMANRIIPSIEREIGDRRPSNGAPFIKANLANVVTPFDDNDEHAAFSGEVAGDLDKEPMVFVVIEAVGVEPGGCEIRRIVAVVHSIAIITVIVVVLVIAIVVVPVLAISVVLVHAVAVLVVYAIVVVPVYAIVVVPIPRLRSFPSLRLRSFSLSLQWSSFQLSSFRSFSSLRSLSSFALPLLLLSSFWSFSFLRPSSWVVVLVRWFKFPSL